MNDCHTCQYKKNIPGDCHILCTKPDLNMTGEAYGIMMGWFFYPLNFDPIWMSKKCCNYKPVSKT